jgi:hypothetical protein
MYVYAPPQMPRQNKCVYSTHVSVGTAVVKTPKMSANMNVAFYSKFFDGLERVTAANGFEFRKTGHAVTNYPAALTVLITPPRGVFCRISTPDRAEVCGNAQQSNGVLKNLATLRAATDRSPYKDQHARIIIMARGKIPN